MKITIVSGPFLPMPPAPCGAVERVWQGLAERFAGRGHQVTVLCQHHPSQRPEETINGVRYLRRTHFLRHRSLPVNLWRDFVYSVHMASLLPRADVVVTNTFWLPALLSLRPDRETGRVAVHVARVPKGQLPLYDRVDRLQAVSQAVRDEIVTQRPWLARKVRIFPYPVDAAVFTPAAVPSVRNPPVVLYTGRLHPEKGVHLLLEAFQQLRQTQSAVRLRVVGPWRVEEGGGGAEYLARLKRQAEGLPVEFLEPVYDRSELAAIYRTADVYCYPSLAEKGETFGVAPLEAMATGLPPVVSDLACFRDFITHEDTGLVFDHRAADAATRLADNLGRLLADAGRRTALGTRAAARAATLTYDAVATLYLEDFAALRDA
jgi:glycosyltransferase involved in cell wall biosynthesis